MCAWKRRFLNIKHIIQIQSYFATATSPTESPELAQGRISQLQNRIYPYFFIVKPRNSASFQEVWHAEEHPRPHLAFLNVSTLQPLPSLL